MKTCSPLLGFLLAALLSPACSQHARVEASYDYYGDNDMEGWTDGEAAPEPDFLESSGGGTGRRAKRMSPAIPASAPPSSRAEGAPPTEATESAGAAQEQLSPMVHYDGWARLRVDSMEALVDGATELASRYEGELERITGDTVVVAVPVEHFDEAFEAALGLGELLSRSVRAREIGQSYTDTSLRLRAARAARERLLELLARAKEAEDRIRILEEIQRLTEQIDTLEGQLRLLSQLAHYSNITLEGVVAPATVELPSAPEPWGFAWIRELSPYRQDVAWEGRKLRVPVPEGFLELEDKGPFTAAAADGSLLWASRRPNLPEGDAAFWASAIEQRLRPAYASVQAESWGDYEVLRFVGRDSQEERAVRYGLALRVRGRFLELVEWRFPSAAEEERHLDALKAALAPAVSKASQPSPAGEVG